jgi:hypothetical protein
VAEEESTPLPKMGTIADLARRMDRIETRHETLEGEVRALTNTVGRLEQNQLHGQELARLRFDAIDVGVRTNNAMLTDFIHKLDGIVTGDVKTYAARELDTDWTVWRSAVDKDRQNATEFITQGRFLGRLVLIVLSTNILALAAGLYALTQMPH